MENIGNRPFAKEAFDKFKAECIAQLEGLTYEDDPHIILISSKGHGEVSRKGCACPGFMVNAAKDIIEAAIPEAAIEVQVLRGEMPLAKGGEA